MIPSTPLVVRLENGRELGFASEAEAKSFFNELRISQHLGEVLSPKDVAAMREHAQIMRDRGAALPAELEDLKKIVGEGKQNATLGQLGAWLEAAKSWVDTAAEGAKLSPHPVPQLAGRVWLGSTQGTKAVIDTVQGKYTEATESGLGALSQAVPGLGINPLKLDPKKVESVLNSGSKGFGAFNSAKSASDAANQDKVDEAVAHGIKGAGELMPNDIAGSAIKATATTYLSGKQSLEMSQLKSGLDKSFENSEQLIANWSERLASQAALNDSYGNLAEGGRFPETLQWLEAMREQMPDIVSQAEAEGIGQTLSDATQVATLQAEKAYRKVDPSGLDDFLERIDQQSAPQTVTPSEKALYWYDPDDKDGFINVVDPGGKLARMSLEDAKLKGLVPADASIDTMTQFVNKDDRFIENGFDTSDRYTSREERINSTIYPDGAVMPGGDRTSAMMDGNGGAVATSGGGLSIEDCEDKGPGHSRGAERFAERAEAAARRALAAKRRAQSARMRVEQMLRRRYTA